MTQERPEPFRGAAACRELAGAGDGRRYHQRAGVRVLDATGENFDFATGDSISALEMLQMIASAGKSRFLLSDGLATVNREGIKPGRGS